MQQSRLDEVARFLGEWHGNRLIWLAITVQFEARTLKNKT
jgi:hypothetical protein